MTMRRSTALILTAAALISAPGCAEKEDALDVQLAAWLEAGHPTTPQEMLPRSVPDERNAATYYLEAGRMIDRLPASDLETLRDGNKYRVAGLAPRLQPILAVAERGRACDACVWPVEFDYPPELGGTPTAYFGTMRNVARLYRAMALAESVNGSREEAMRLIEAGLEVASDLDAAPETLHPLVKYAIKHLVLDAYREIFVEGDLPANRVAQLLAASDVQRDMRQAVIFETAVWLAAYESGRLADKISGGDDEKAARAELAWLLENVSRALAGDVATVDATFMSTRPQPQAIFTKPAPPQPWAPLQSADRHQVTLDLLRMGVRLREYKEQHGDYPETFDSPIDPLTGGPYRYTKTRRGCVVASEYESRHPLEWRWE